MEMSACSSPVHCSEHHIKALRFGLCQGTHILMLTKDGLDLNNRAVIYNCPVSDNATRRSSFVFLESQ